MHETPIFPRSLIRLVAVLCLATVPALWAQDQQSVIDAHGAFERLKETVGTWRGPASVEEGEGLWVTHEIRLVVNGDVVMETMKPSSGHEMINMYHMDGDDLILAHYCSGGHHPTMKLDLDRSNHKELIFNFASGRNFDPAVDKHIHDAKIVFLDENHMNSSWRAYKNGKPLYEATFKLIRTGGN